MDDLRTRLGAALAVALEEMTRRTPAQIPLTVPLAPLVDAVIEVMADGHGVPLAPVYDAEVWQRRRWYEPSGSATTPGSAIGVDADGDTVVWTVEHDAGATTVRLPVNDAFEHALHGLAAAEHVQLLLDDAQAARSAAVKAQGDVLAARRDAEFASRAAAEAVGNAEVASRAASNAEQAIATVLINEAEEARAIATALTDEAEEARAIATALTDEADQAASALNATEEALREATGRAEEAQAKLTRRE
jgi:FtsZ-binding cell division protein ZapB